MLSYSASIFLPRIPKTPLLQQVPWNPPRPPTIFYEMRNSSLELHSLYLGISVTTVSLLVTSKEPWLFRHSLHQLPPPAVIFPDVAFSPSTPPLHSPRSPTIYPKSQQCWQKLSFIKQNLKRKSQKRRVLSLGLCKPCVYVRVP